MSKVDYFAPAALAEVRSSALEDYDGLLKGLSVRVAGMSVLPPEPVVASKRFVKPLRSTDALRIWAMRENVWPT